MSILKKEGYKMCDAKVENICRVVGYLRPAHLYNDGKIVEHKIDRKCYKI